MTNALAAEIVRAASLPVETAAVIHGRVVHCPNEIRVLAREIHWVQSEHYARREVSALSVAAEGYVQSLARADTQGCVPIWFHTHPGDCSDARPSAHDHAVDAQIADLFRLRSGSAYYGALIVAPRTSGMTFTGFLEESAGDRTTFSRLWSVGERLRLTWPYGVADAVMTDEFDRNVRAFGPAIQNTLKALRIGIVGCGGTGSAVAEQITRLGARKLTLIDPDTLSQSNVTRVYGSRPGLVGRPKVEVLSHHLQTIAPDALVASIQGMVTNRRIAEHLLDCDVVFGCTDDNAGRLVLSRLATWFLVPVFDCGVVLTTKGDNTLAGIDGRVTTLIPGHACLVCRGRVDLQRARTELLTPGERKRLVDEGYAPALGAVEPSVVTFTTTVASFAVTELLDRLIGFGAEPSPSEILLRLHDREVSTNICLPRQGHYCDEHSERLGLGMTEPLLDQTWPD